MRFWLLISVCVLSLATLSCSRGSAPTLPAGTSAPALGTPLVLADNALIPLATVTIDLATLTAHQEPLRAAHNFQGNLYDLDIAAFQTAESFRITGVRADVDGNAVLDYSHAHPFRAPDFAQPVTGQNRADLGYTGRTLFVVDVPSSQVAAQTFFSGVVANTRVVANADGYLEVGDLLTQGQGFNANAFPYRLIVDEVRNNRVGISNAGSFTGNYNPATGGWQRGNIGPNNTGWTGYDYLHQGQSARSFVTIHQAAFASGTATFTVALLIRYADPRGDANKAHRFPAQPVDVLKFAYRLPYAALDASKIAAGGLALDTATGSNGALTIRVRDWDARATETTFADLGDDPDVAKIQQQGSGVPVVTLSVPALANSAFTATEETPMRSGLPGDELRFQAAVTNSKGTALPGQVMGLIRVIDPEESDPQKSVYHFGVDPYTLAASPSRALPVRVYQAAPITINGAAGSEPMCGATHINGSGTIPPGGQFTLDLASITDADSATLDLQFAYTGAGSAGTSVLTLNTSALVLESAFNPFTDPRLATKLFAPTALGNYQLTVTLNDGAHEPVVCGPYLFSVQAEFPPNCGTGVTVTPEIFTGASAVVFLANLSALTDPGNPGSINLTFSYSGPESDSSSVLTRSFPLPGNFNPFTDPGLAKPLVSPQAAGQYLFTVTIDDGINDPVPCSAPFTIQFCGAPNTAPDITLAPTFAMRHNLNSTPASWYNFYTTQDYAAFSDGTPGYAFQRYDTPLDPHNGAIENYDLWHFTTPGNPATATRMTSYFTAGNQVVQLEIDQTNRVLYSFRPFDDAWDVGSNYANPNTQVHWFNYTGATVASVGGSITLPRPPVALALDADDSLWVIDRDNRLTHWVPAPGPAGYAVVEADELNLGTLLGIGLNAVVCDFVINFHNGAKYILTNSGPSRNGRLYRVECAGNLWTGGTNPANFPLSTGSQFPGVPDGGDLGIDQLDAEGNLLEGAQDAQLVVFHAASGGGLLVFNADLEQTVASTGGTLAGARGVVVGVGNYAVSNEFGDLVTGEAWAWQDRWGLPVSWQ